MRQSLLAIIFLIVNLIANLSAIRITADDSFLPSSALIARDSGPATLPPAPSAVQPQQPLSPKHESLRNDRNHLSESRIGEHEKTGIVNVTTTIISQGPDSNIVYHNGSRADQKGSSGIDSPNAENVTRELEEDRAALKRLVTILSVVGCVSVLALVVSILIFARIRKKRRRFQNGLLEEVGGFQRESCSSPHSPTPAASPPQQNQSISNHCALAVTQGEHLPTPNIDNTYYGVETTRIMPEPSAPLAPFPVDCEQGRSSKNQRIIVSFVPQTSPAPSAPSAKEIDVSLDQNSPSFLLRHRESSLDIPHLHLPDKTCSRCDVEPEFPPPAYSPSAPPFCVSSPPQPLLLSRRSSSLPRRRHSQG